MNNNIFRGGRDKMPARSRYVTEYRAKFKPIDFEEAYRPPVLKPRVPIESPVLREIALRDRNEAKEQKPPAAHRTYTVSKNNSRGVSVVSDVSSEVQNRKVNLEEKKEKQKNNRGLQYKAGLALAIPRPNKENFLSEYRRQFGWKKPAEKETPILSADKIIFRSQANVSPEADARQKTKFSFKTEYQSQFIQHPWTPVKRSSKKPHPSPDKLNNSNASDDSGVYDSEPSPKKPPSHPKVPPRSFVGQSEYRTNFQPPSSFRYAKGAWVGAGPPHLHMHQDHEAKEGEDAQPSRPKRPHISWFQQVLELRDKARNYKSQARDGSQALQVFRRDQEERETNTPKRDTNLESPVNHRDILLQANQREQAQHKSRCDEHEEISAAVAEKSKEYDCKENGKNPVHPRTDSSLSESQHSMQGDQRSPDCGSSISSINLNEELNLSPYGRPATSELLEKRDTRRHHLDVTTPARGGPLLVSPPLDRVRRGPFNVYDSECASTCSSDEQHSVLSETAMERRRALATETLNRARKQRAEVARRTCK